MNRKPDPYGRDATRPFQIPLKGWWQVAQRVWSETNRDNLSVVAAGCAFFALFAIFPALSALISLYGLTADPATVEQHFGMLGSVLPTQAYDMVIEQIHRISAASGGTLGWSLAVSLGLALWSANAGTQAMMAALNIAYEEPERRSLFQYYLNAFTFTIIGILGGMVMLLAIVYVPILFALNAEYFNLSEKETRIAKALLEPRVPTLDQVVNVVRNMPTGSEIELRNRALIAFTLLTGARDGALASLKLKHVNIAEGHVRQDAREVHTKFAKTFTTWFFPVGDEVRAIVEQWVDYLLIQKLWSLDDPLFPATRVVLGTGRQFEAAGLDRRHWSDAGPIRKIFKEAFQRGRLPYFNPHSFRKTLALLGQGLCRTPEEFKAWSQNLGHENRS